VDWRSRRHFVLHCGTLFPVGGGGGGGVEAIDEKREGNFFIKFQM